MKIILSCLPFLFSTCIFAQCYKSADTVYISSYMITKVDTDSILKAIKEAATEYKRYKRGFNIYLPENQAVLELVLNDYSVSFEEKRTLLTEKIIMDWNNMIFQNTQYPDYRGSVTISTHSKEKALAAYLTRTGTPPDFSRCYWAFPGKGLKGLSHHKSIIPSKSIEARLLVLKTISKTDVSRVYFLKGGQAATVFGSGGVDGAIIIEGKKIKKSKSKKHSKL